jgi:hypothetical protein
MTQTIQNIINSKEVAKENISIFGCVLLHETEYYVLFRCITTKKIQLLDYIGYILFINWMYL